MRDCAFVLRPCQRRPWLARIFTNVTGQGTGVVVIDLVILGFLALLLVRGWTRGLVREAMDLVGLVIGTILAFRLGPAFGAIVRAMADVSDEVARFIGGFIVFFAVGIGAAIATRAIDRTARLPGLIDVQHMPAATGAGVKVPAFSYAVVRSTPEGPFSQGHKGVGKEDVPECLMK